MTEYITTKDTAKLVRAALKSAFPGVKFSVRMSTGTASAWMHVSWEDGPTDREVTAITSVFEGRKFNSMTDGYDSADSVLVAASEGEMPREIRYVCDGINTSRHYSKAGNVIAQRIISAASDNKLLAVFTPDGEPVPGVRLPADMWVAGHYVDCIYSPESLARRILHYVNFAAVEVHTR